MCGLGLSSNLNSADQPHPYRLLAESPGLFDFVEYSAPLSLDETRQHASLFPEMWERRGNVPVLFHPVHLNLYGPELEPVKALTDLDAHARAVGSAWVGNDIGWWHSGGQPFPGYLYFTPPFTEAGVPSQRVRLIPGRALEVLPRLTDGHYDLVFADGDKEEYPAYLDEALRLVRPGGIVAFDNALWHDRVADPAQRDGETVAIRELVRTVAEHDRLVPLLLPVGDGLLVAKKVWTPET